MKYALLFLMLLVPGLSAKAQVEYGEIEDRPPKAKRNYEPAPVQAEKVWNIRTKADSLEYELYCTRFFLGKYREQIARSRRLIVVGTSISVASLVFAEPQSNISIAGTALGGTIFFVGGLINWSAGKWLRKVSVKPTQYGMSLSVLF